MKTVNLGKKRDLKSNNNPINLKDEFINNYFPQLVNKKDRNKYFVKYEFKDKQNFLIDFWSQAVEKVFNILIKGFCMKEIEIVEIFTIDNKKPMSLIQIIDKIKKSNKYIEIKNIDKDIGKLLNLVDNNSYSIFNVIKNFFVKKKDKDENNNLNDSFVDFYKNVDEKSTLIYTINFKKLYENAKIKYPRIFSDNKILEESIFFKSFDNICHLNRIDTIIVVRLFLKLKLLYKKKEQIKNKLYIFYSLLEPKNEEFKKEIVMFKFKKEIDSLNFSKDTFNNKKIDINEKIDISLKDLKQCKSNQEKDHVKKIIRIFLAHRKNINKKLEDLNQKIIFFEEQEFRFKNENDPNFWKEVNNMMEKLKDDNVKFNDNLLDIEENLKEIKFNEELVDKYFNELQEEDEKLLEEFEKELKENNSKEDELITKNQENLNGNGNINGNINKDNHMNFNNFLYN